MMDQLLSRLLWMVVMGLIVATGGAALCLLYNGLLLLCWGQFPVAAGFLPLTLLLAGACYLLCRHGNDLMDR